MIAEVSAYRVIRLAERPCFVLAILIGFIAFVAVFMYFRWMFTLPRTVRWKHVLVIGGLLLLFLGLSGRLHWVAALFGAAFPLIFWGFRVLRSLPWMRGILGFFFRSSRLPTVTTEYLRVSIDMENRSISGSVIKGQFNGREICGLSDDELQQLLTEMEGSDHRGVIIIKSFVHLRQYGQHQQSAERASRRQSPGAHNTMSAREALDILGLKSNASNEDIVKAHRRLMQRMHPDRDGSKYLAVLINQAKKVLIRQ